MRVMLEGLDHPYPRRRSARYDKRADQHPASSQGAHVKGGCGNNLDSRRGRFVRALGT